MKYYEAKALLAIGAGAVLHLTDAQAEARRYGLTAIKDRPGHYKSGQPLQFKTGEVFGSDVAPGGDKAVELKSDAKEFDARCRKEREAKAQWKQEQLAARKRQADAAAAAQKRKQEARA